MYEAEYLSFIEGSPAKTYRPLKPSRRPRSRTKEMAGAGPKADEFSGVRNIVPRRYLATSSGRVKNDYNRNESVGFPT